MPPAFCAWAMTCKRDGGFAGRFRPEDFDDPAAGKPAYAQGSVE